MTGPNREWVTIPVPGKVPKRWMIDVTFLTSSWQCIFGAGCQGVLTEPAPEIVEGCCSFGAHFSDKEDRDRVVKIAQKLTAKEWQFKSVGDKRGVVASAGKKEWRTRLVDDACIFLNRPGFPSGPGCALHLLALRLGEHFVKTKPIVCWQLPLRAEERDEDDGSITAVLSEFERSGWGEGGEDFAWWCTEAPEAFSAPEPVYKTLEAELRETLGDDVYSELAKYLDERMRSGTPLLHHPAEKPVALRPTRRRR